MWIFNSNRIPAFVAFWEISAFSGIQFLLKSWSVPSTSDAALLHSPKLFSAAPAHRQESVSIFGLKTKPKGNNRFWKRREDEWGPQFHVQLCFVVKISGEQTPLLMFHDNRPQQACSCQLGNYTHIARPARSKASKLRLLMRSNTFKAHTFCYSIKYSQPALNKAKKYSTCKIVLSSNRQVRWKADF